jgi:hypothetical protein
MSSEFYTHAPFTNFHVPFTLTNFFTNFHATFTLSNFHVPFTLTTPPTPRFLQVIQPRASDQETEFTEHVQQALAAALDIQHSSLVEGDVQKWLAGNTPTLS